MDVDRSCLGRRIVRQQLNVRRLAKNKRDLLKIVVGMTFVVSVVVRLEFLAGLEADGFAGGDRNFFARSWVSPNTSLAGFYDKHPKAAQFNSLASGQCFFH